MQNADADSLKYTISGSILVKIREMLIVIPVNREFWFSILVNCAQDPPFRPSNFTEHKQSY